MNKPADICLVLEGTYPFVHGGVSSWVHDLILQHENYTFALLCLMPANAPLEDKYDVPDNVISRTVVPLQVLAKGKAAPQERADTVEPLLTAWLAEGTAAQWQQLSEHINAEPALLHHDTWFRSRFGWRVMQAMYNRFLPDGAFLDFYWTWRIAVASLLSVIAAPIPPARCYHALCTGYAGLFAARAALTTGRPCLVTEHGIYTNERNIEIAAAEWLEDGRALNLAQGDDDSKDASLKRFMRRFFRSAAYTLYQKANPIVTLYEENRILQVADGADDALIKVIPNGIDVERCASIEPLRGRPPTVGLIGRVVPIKDIKTFIRMIGILCQQVPDVRALMIGANDEDPVYARECSELVANMGLQDTIEFTGRQKLLDVLPQLDVAVLTSLSEAQPLVILEAGAAGIPFVATNVGSCRELICGSRREQPPLGAGGDVCPLGAPQTMATSVRKLLTDQAHYHRCSNALRTRVHTYYRREQQQQAYAALYADVLKEAK